MKKAVLKKFAVFTAKFQTCNFIKKRLQHTPLNMYIEMFKSTYFEEHLLMAMIVQM